MKDMKFGLDEGNPPKLTSTQMQVFNALSTKKSEKYPLSNWYLGAIYALKNTHNPDRFSQAAQSLRELLEKLPRVFVESEIPVSKPNFSDLRRKLYSRLSIDKNRYEGEWEKKIIDAKLDKTICKVDCYLAQSRMLLASEQNQIMMSKLDPMYHILDQKIRSEKFKKFQNLRNYLVGVAHHGTVINEQSFFEQLALTEYMIIDLLAPVTAQDQGVIQGILNKLKPNQAEIENLLRFIKRRGANYVYFFKNADSPVWIKPLEKNDFFKNSSSEYTVSGGSINTSIWWPIFYLQRVSEQEPQQVVDIILSLEKTDNPRILGGILSIASDLQDTALSLRLYPLIDRFLKSPDCRGGETQIVKILKKWSNCQGPARNAAYKILRYVSAFQPDPMADEKRSRRKENSNAWDTSLDPILPFEQWEYEQTLELGVRPLAEQGSLKIACILINVVADMIRFTMHQEDLDKESDQDYSEIWCPRLDKSVRRHRNSNAILMRTLTYACEQVYDKASKSINDLDQALRKHRWRVFKRLRQHLYASHLNNQTLPWVREQIICHKNYAIKKHHFEFQLMNRKASEHFGFKLLSEDERNDIFSAILSGPSIENFRKKMGERYSEEDFQQFQRHFHRMQLRPFTKLLTDEVRNYFDDLEGKTHAKAITDESYSPGGVTGGTVSFQSPRSIEELQNLTDEEVLTYLNEWDDEHQDKDNWLIEINISSLASVFKSLFKEHIACDGERLSFWMKHRNEISRPIFVAAMIETMLELAKEMDFENLNKWIEFCAWVLSHPETERVEGQIVPSDKSCEHPDWCSSRRAVIDFIRACVNEETKAPINARDGLADLLQQACCQFDWRLDQKITVLRDRDDPIFDAINNTRSLALESLICFGFWVRDYLPKDNLPEVTSILAKRIAVDAEFPLTRPEHALLGMHFKNLYILNRDWTLQQREIIFPQENQSVWQGAFGSYIRYNQPSKIVFEILRDEYEYAVENLNILQAEIDDSKELVDKLGHHLFFFYLWEAYPLSGGESLLERFYDNTNGDRERWKQLFASIGQILPNDKSSLDIELTDRIIDFFDWRFEAAEPLEFQGFTFWLDAECLDPDWRLRSYSKILDRGLGKDVGISLQIKYLNKLLPDHLALVVECFAKITDAMDQDGYWHSLIDEAKPILEAGLNAKDPGVLKNAERAKENMAKRGVIDYTSLQ